jgi:hypothetical protein
LNENGDTNLNWVYFIRTILNECGFTYIWETENVNNKEWSNPQTSQPYKRIGFIIISKRSSWIFTDNLYNLPILRTSYIALSALSAFLNDLEECLLTKDIVGLKSITDELETELEIYLKIFVMLYADDTILLAESAEDLEVQLKLTKLV